MSEGAVAYIMGVIHSGAIMFWVGMIVSNL